jgi:hypothetical protein
MNEQNDKELKSLLETFLDAEQSRQTTEDIRKGEKFLREHPAPEPDINLIADIKAHITRALIRKKAVLFRKRAYKTAAIAAAIIIAATISVKLFDKEGGEPERKTAASATTIAKAIWEGDDISIDDLDLAVLKAEIEQIEETLVTLQLGEDSDNGGTHITELELELSGTEDDFWKG